MSFLCNYLEMSRDNIDEIVLVGGTTRIPHVKQQLRYISIVIIHFFYFLLGSSLL